MHNFWVEQKIEDQFVNLFVKTGFDMLENLNSFKNSDLKPNIFDILQRCMELYGDQCKYMLNQNSTKIINMLYNQDNLAKPLAEFVGLVGKKADNQLPTEVIRDLTKQIFHNDS